MEKETYDLPNNRKLKIVYDSSPDNPRTFESNLAKVILTGTKKSLGDNHEFSHNDYNDWEEYEKAILKRFNVAIIKPIYMYSHSGETIATTPFSCQWDSSQIGFVIVTKEAIRQDYHITRVSPHYKNRAEIRLDGEIEMLDQYISGEVFGFKVVDSEDEEEDSCFGFFGEDITKNGILDYLLEEDKIAVLRQIK